MKFIATYTALIPVVERVVVRADNEEDALAMARQEIAMMRNADKSNSHSAYQLDGWERDD